METKAVLLAAGQGTRLLPLTNEIPKSLIKIKERSIIEYIIDRLVDIGIKEIIIATGHCGHKLKDKIGDNYRGVPVTYVDNPIYDKTNSTYSLWLAKDFVGDDFIVINADTICTKDVLKDIAESDYEIALAVDDTLTGELPEDAMKVTIVNGLIKNASKQIPVEKTHGDAIGIYKFKGRGVIELYNELERVINEKILDQLFTFAVRRLMDRIDVYPVSTKGLPWIEIDDHEDLKNAEEVVEKILEEEKILEGQNTGFETIVSGKLRTINNNSEMGNIETGDIVMISPKLYGGDGLLPIYRAIKQGAVGIIRTGGKVDHGAIASKELGVPCVLINHNVEDLDRYENKVVTINRGSVFSTGCTPVEDPLPSIYEQTKRKVKINLGFPDVIEKYPVLAEKSDGVAFTRFEFIMLEILNGLHPLSYIKRYGSEQLALKIADAIRPVVREFAKYDKEVWLRTDDFSPEFLIAMEDGEKYEQHETNPNSGWRGIRRSIQQKDMIIPQFMAVRKLLEEGYTNIGLFPPMTSFYREYKEWKSLAISYGLDRVKFGLMVETPSAALTIENFINDIDFVIFGSNDLTQFTLGIDRSNSRLTDMFDEKEEAVLKLMKGVIEVCNQHGVETTIGGQAGSDQTLINKLINYGISGTSVNPDPWTLSTIKGFISEKEKNFPEL
jgi:pyruvate,water dikinase